MAGEQYTVKELSQRIDEGDYNEFISFVQNFPWNKDKLKNLLPNSSSEDNQGSELLHIAIMKYANDPTESRLQIVRHFWADNTIEYKEADRQGNYRGRLVVNWQGKRNDENALDFTHALMKTKQGQGNEEIIDNLIEIYAQLVCKFENGNLELENIIPKFQDRIKGRVNEINTKSNVISHDSAASDEKAAPLETGSSTDNEQNDQQHRPRSETVISSLASTPRSTTSQTPDNSDLENESDTNNGEHELSVLKQENSQLDAPANLYKQNALIAAGMIGGTLLMGLGAFLFLNGDGGIASSVFIEVGTELISHFAAGTIIAQGLVLFAQGLSLCDNWIDDHSTTKNVLTALSVIFALSLIVFGVATIGMGGGVVAIGSGVSILMAVTGAGSGVYNWFFHKHNPPADYQQLSTPTHSAAGTLKPVNSDAAGTGMEEEQITAPALTQS